MSASIDFESIDNGEDQLTAALQLIAEAADDMALVGFTGWQGPASDAARAELADANAAVSQGRDLGTWACALAPGHAQDVLAVNSLAFDPNTRLVTDLGGHGVH